MLLVSAVALLHAAVVVFVVAGGLLALRHRWILVVHLPVAVALVAVNLAGADCPLTSLELALRDAAGSEVYAGGFLQHYLFGPLGVDGSSSAAQSAQRLLVAVPNLLAYAVLAARSRPRTSSDGGRVAAA